MTQEKKNQIPPTFGPGSLLVEEFDNVDNVLTDAEPTREIGPFRCRGMQKVLATIETNKACDLYYVPMHDENAAGVPQREGKKSTVVQIANGGGKERVVYSSVMSPWIKLVMTKTEAGDMDVYYGEVSGGL